jgi:hypothetical protein
LSSNSSRLYVVRSGTSATNSTAVSVTTSVKTVLSVLGTAATTIALKRVRVSFPSVTASEAAATVEVGIISALGTVTAFTPVQITGRPVASAASAGYNASVEPTYVSIFETTYCPVQNGVFEWWYPLGEEPNASVSQGFALRVTAPATMNCYASLLYGE